MAMKMRPKIKIELISATYRPRHGRRYTKYKMCLSIMIVICVKVNLSNI